MTQPDNQNQPTASPAIDRTRLQSMEWAIRLRTSHTAEQPDVVQPEELITQTIEMADRIYTWLEGPEPSPANPGHHDLAPLYNSWVSMGPPPLGISMSRWWDARLTELRAALDTD